MINRSSENQRTYVLRTQLKKITWEGKKYSSIILNARFLIFISTKQPYNTNYFLLSFSLILKNQSLAETSAEKKKTTTHKNTSVARTVFYKCQAYQSCALQERNYKSCCRACWSKQKALVSSTHPVVTPWSLMTPREREASIIYSAIFSCGNAKASWVQRVTDLSALKHVRTGCKP